MRTISVQVQPDHLRRITAVKRPILALAELIWNGLDADAKEVRVILERDALGLLSAVRVLDYGLGIPYTEALDAFGNLGGSWKRDRDRTRRDGRLLHGRAGKGRFRAFSLGARVTWSTRVVEDGSLLGFQVEGTLDRLGQFTVSDPVPSEGPTGTEVRIDEIQKQFRSLEGPSAVQAMTEELALYLRKYADVKVQYDGVTLDPSIVEVRNPAKSSTSSGAFRPPIPVIPSSRSEATLV